MSLKAKIAAGAATFALAGGGLGAAGTLSASAATPSCANKCVTISTLKFGPSYLLETNEATAAAGQEFILSIASNSDQGEDFVANKLGTVRSVSMGSHSLITSQFAKAYPSGLAYEYEYAPLGILSHLCASTWPGMVAQAGFVVRLEPCGKYSNSVWVTQTPKGDQTKTGYFVAINGATKNFSDPLVLTYPAGYPTDTPSPTVTVEPLNSFADGTVFDDQQWTYATGTVNSNPLTGQLRLHSDCIVTRHPTGGWPRACRPSVLFPGAIHGPQPVVFTPGAFPHCPVTEYFPAHVLSVTAVTAACSAGGNKAGRGGTGYPNFGYLL
jgi:hypothetical protein